MIVKKKVLLIGVGLIGGSVALAIKKTHDVKIIGYDICKDNCQLAQKLNIIDKYVENYQDVASQADLIILACPVIQAERILEQLAYVPLKENVLITDVGSTKKSIMEKVQKFSNIEQVFIGGHPMAGSHKGGPGSAKAHLFENAYYVLTPTNKTEGKVEELIDWLAGTNAKFTVMDPIEHDIVTGIVSHFPHIVAASLVRHVRNFGKEYEAVHYLAAGGFRDITRIASSSPEMWRDIVINNKSVLLSQIDAWINEMKHVQTLIENNDSEGIYNYFAGAKKYRDALPVRAKGAITSFYDLYVDVLDKPGVISDITTLLAKENISITNIRIIEAREDVFGVLRLSFQSEKDVEKARKLLEQNGYRTYISM